MRRNSKLVTLRGSRVSAFALYQSDARYFVKYTTGKHLLNTEIMVKLSLVAIKTYLLKANPLAIMTI